MPCGFQLDRWKGTTVLEAEAIYDSKPQYALRVSIPTVAMLLLRVGILVANWTPNVLWRPNFMIQCTIKSVASMGCQPFPIPYVSISKWFYHIEWTAWSHIKRTPLYKRSQRKLNKLSWGHTLCGSDWHFLCFGNGAVCLSRSVLSVSSRDSIDWMRDRRMEQRKSNSVRFGSSYDHTGQEIGYSLRTTESTREMSYCAKRWRLGCVN